MIYTVSLLGLRVEADNEDQAKMLALDLIKDDPLNHLHVSDGKYVDAANKMIKDLGYGLAGVNALSFPKDNDLPF